MVHGENLKTF